MLRLAACLHPRALRASTPGSSAGRRAPRTCRFLTSGDDDVSIFDERSSSRIIGELLQTGASSVCVCAIRHACAIIRYACASSDMHVTSSAFIAFTRSNLASELRTATSCHFFKHSLNISPTYRYSFPPSLARSLSVSLSVSISVFLLPIPDALSGMRTLHYRYSFPARPRATACARLVRPLLTART